MEIRINGKLAALKKGTSFEYVSENRLFTGSDGYTLTITFPLRGCAANLAIFGNVNRADVALRKVVFDCEIRDLNFFKTGSIVITELNEVEVKTQFLEGRSEQNYDRTFDKVYINELDLGAPPTTDKTKITPEDAWYPNQSQPQYVALPWVNDYSGNIQNKAGYVNLAPMAYYAWYATTTGLSWQPYLLFLTKKICEAVGYTPDLTRWEQHDEYKFLLVCNTLPYAWEMPEFANALPHWTVEEYFEKLELFIGGEFDIDHRAKTITFAFTDGILANKEPVMLDKVIEEHSTEVKVDEESSEYLGAKNLIYKDCDHEMWKFYSCDWFIENFRRKGKSYHTMKELLADNKSCRTWSGARGRTTSNIDKLLYAEDVDAYFIVRPISRTATGEHRRNGNRVIEYTYTCRLQPVNLFGGRIVNEDENASTEDIEFVPAWIDDTDDTYGRVLFLSFSDYDDDTGEGDDEEDYPFLKTVTLSTLDAGEKDKKAEYYDRIYVGWWDGAMDAKERGKLPRPQVDNVIVAEDWSSYRRGRFSLRINTGSYHLGVDLKYQIQPKMKTTFKFLADAIPDVRALYIIQGKRYICEKLTATFTETGMSQLIKGVFYPVVD